jgi:hypothetical protein
MDEAAWLACADPLDMLRHLGRRRKRGTVRLLECALCRRKWHLLADERSRRAVDAAELFAAGLLGVRGLRAAGALAHDAATEAEMARARADAADVGERPSPATLEAEAAKWAADAARHAARLPLAERPGRWEGLSKMALAEGAWVAARIEGVGRTGCGPAARVERSPEGGQRPAAPPGRQPVPPHRA